MLIKSMSEVEWELMLENQHIDLENFEFDLRFEKLPVQILYEQNWCLLLMPAFWTKYFDNEEPSTGGKLSIVAFMDEINSFVVEESE